MTITTVGIDLAKNVFQIHGVDERGKATLKKQLKRAQMADFFATLPPSFVGMEACGSAHHWARKLQRFGHTVRLMAPQFVKPYVKTNKNDAADAEAICEAVARPNMRFVPIKSVEQQAVLALHRARQGFVKARTSQANQIRGLLADFGLVIPQGIGNIARQVPQLIEDATNELPGSLRLLMQRLLEHLRSWTVKPTKLAPRSRRGTGIASQAENSLKFQESDRLPPVRWRRPSAALGTSPAVANWRRGSVLCLDKAPVEGRTSYSASASGETRICERCSSMALAQ